MNKIYFLICLFFINTVLIAQQTFVPDANFEQALIDLGYDVGPLNNYVPTENINGVLSLDVSNKNINDLTGIEDFINLEYLDCSYNNINILNLSYNTALKELFCNANDLTYLNITLNSELRILNCDSNNLTHLNVSFNSSLEFLYCIDNHISSIDTSYNTNLERLRCSSNNLVFLNIKNGNNNSINPDIVLGFEAYDNPNLDCIQVDNTAYSNANWTHKDNHSVYSESCELTYVPDDDFEQALINLGYDVGALNNYVPTANINRVTALDVSNKGITDLTGIEDFSALEELGCENNNLTVLEFDSDQYNSLRYLDCSNNNLNSLDILESYSLSYLNCSYNNLSHLVLPENSVALNTTVSCSNNTNLETIDFRAFRGNLQFLYCSNTNLSSLDMEGFTKLEILEINNNQSLTNFRLSRNMGLGEEPTVVIDSKNNPLLTSVQCEYSLVSDLNVSNNTSLRSVYCPSNFIRTLNVNNTPSLTTIECQNFFEPEPGLFVKGPLTNLDLSTSPSLSLLDCRNNRITYLDISNNPELFSLECDNNNLEILKVNNGNNINFGVITAKNNYSLNCIEVDDVAYSDQNWRDNSATNAQFDEDVVFSEFCNYIYTPIIDVEFEQTLIDFGYDEILDGYVLTSNISSIKKLDVSKKAISNLSGIEYFSALETLYCKKNKLTSLDLSFNGALKYLDCSDNKLEVLNIKNGNNPKFITINTANNPNLSCIKVDNMEYSNKYWRTNVLQSCYFNFDNKTGFSEHCITLRANDIKKNIYQIYPNPIFNILKISSKQPIDQIILFNLLGTKVLTTDKTEIDFSHLSSGMYLVKIKANDKTVVKRIIKQ